MHVLGNQCQLIIDGLDLHMQILKLLLWSRGGGTQVNHVVRSTSKKTRERVLFMHRRRPRLGYQFHEILEKKGILFSSLISSFNV